MIALGMCLLAHWLLARFVPWPWWVPNLTLAGLMLAIVKRPGQWLPLALVAGFFASLWTVRASGGILVSYLAAGALMQAMARRWDLEHGRVQWWLAGAGTFVFSLAVIWLEAIPVLPVLGLVIGHAAVTCAALPLARRLAAVSS